MKVLMGAKVALCTGERVTVSWTICDMLCWERCPLPFLETRQTCPLISCNPQVNEICK